LTYNIDRACGIIVDRAADTVRSIFGSVAPNHVAYLVWLTDSIASTASAASATSSRACTALTYEIVDFPMTYWTLFGVMFTTTIISTNSSSRWTRACRWKISVPETFVNLNLVQEEKGRKYDGNRGEEY
jgi:hypothetical protein